MDNIFGLTLTGLVTGVFARLIGSGAEILIVPLLTIFGIRFIKKKNRNFIMYDTPTYRCFFCYEIL